MKQEKKNTKPQFDNNKILEELKKVKAENLELRIGWQRTQADLENFRKRTESDKINLLKYANEDLILQILPILDNFARALLHKPKELENNDYLKGLELTEKQLEKILSDVGLTKIPAKIGDIFNPQLHEAISTEQNPKFRPDQVMEIIQDGYKLGDKIIRPAKVKVAK